MKIQRQVNHPIKGRLIKTLSGRFEKHWRPLGVESSNLNLTTDVSSNLNRYILDDDEGRTILGT